MLHYNQVGWYFRIFLCLSLLASVVQPLFAQDPGWLPPADPSEHIIPDYQDDGRGPHMPLEPEIPPSRQPDFLLPEQAAEVVDLAPDYLPRLNAVYDLAQERETALVAPIGAAVIFLEGRVTIIAGPDSFGETVTLALKPLANALETAGDGGLTAPPEEAWLEPAPAPYPHEWLQFEIEALRLSDG